jgi:uncharacterized oligopeptide transporter (OPT) family protein
MHAGTGRMKIESILLYLVLGAIITSIVGAALYYLGLPLGERLSEGVVAIFVGAIFFLLFLLIEQRKD